MSDSPIVSIVVAVFNMKEHIRQCIESVLGQSVQDIELILVDDVSTDGTANILKEYQQRDARVKIVWQKENAGAQVARNAGIEVSQGRYITTLDHDDFLHPKAIEYAIRAFKAIDGMGLSRVDFFVRYKDNSIVLNEINTLPGFTSISMYPKLFMNEGMSYSEILDNVIEFGLK